MPGLFSVGELTQRKKLTPIFSSRATAELRIFQAPPVHPAERIADFFPLCGDRARRDQPVPRRLAERGPAGDASSRRLIAQFDPAPVSRLISSTSSVRYGLPSVWKIS
jgi:hypothetical protein